MSNFALLMRRRFGELRRAFTFAQYEARELALRHARQLARCRWQGSGRRT
jgi:hypothetical protein